MDNEFRDKMLLEIITNQATSKVLIDEIRIDLKEHMKRTAINEERIDYVKKHVYFVQGAIGLISLLALIATIISKLSI